MGAPWSTCPRKPLKSSRSGMSACFRSKRGRGMSVWQVDAMGHGLRIEEDRRLRCVFSDQQNTRPFLLRLFHGSERSDANRCRGAPSFWSLGPPWNWEMDRKNTPTGWDFDMSLFCPFLWVLFSFCCFFRFVWPLDCPLVLNECKYMIQ